MNKTETFDEQDISPQNSDLMELVKSKDPYPGLMTSHGITHRDRWDVLRCDLLLANFDGCKGISIGTAMEIAWANLAGKYVLTVMTDTNYHYHGMIIEASSLIIPAFSAALTIIPDLLGRETLT